jgi:hypothetical protein
VAVKASTSSKETEMVSRNGFAVKNTAPFSIRNPSPNAYP